MILKVQLLDMRETQWYSKISEKKKKKKVILKSHSFSHFAQQAILNRIIMEYHNAEIKKWYFFSMEKKKPKYWLYLQ